MEVQDNIISLEDELFSFDRYFEANSRCVLSAPFGEGKSFFLNEFIKRRVAIMISLLYILRVIRFVIIRMSLNILREIFCWHCLL